MTNEAKRKIAYRTAALAALVLAFAAVWLIADAVVERRRAAHDEALTTELEDKVLTDAATAPVLEGERERVTDWTLQREARNRRLGIVALAAAVVFLSAAKLYQQMGEEKLPTREELIQIRLAPVAVKPRAAADDNGNGEIDLAFVDEVIARAGTSREAAIPILQAIQTHYRYLPEEALRRVCELTEITPAQIAGSSTFYAQFRGTPVGRHLIRICHGTACHVAGVGQVSDELRRQLDIPPDDDTDAERRFTLDPVACLGCCSLAPVMMIGEDTAGHLTPTSAWETLKNLEGTS